MYPPNISLGFGVPRKTKSRRLNNLMYFHKFSCISARSRVHFVDNSLNESIDCHVAPSFRKPRAASLVWYQTNHGLFVRDSLVGTS